MIYTDAYLFDLASDMLDRDYSTTQVVEHMVLTCAGTTRERIVRIVSLAFDPSSER